MTELRSILTAIFLFTLTTNVIAQSYLNKNEYPLISFNTNTGKKVVVAVDSVNRYITYRFGTIERIELQYPKEPTGSYERFKWVFDMIHHQTSDYAGDNIDFYELYFTNDNYTYKIYQKIFTSNDSETSRNIGVIVINNITNNEVNIKGLPNTQIGDLENVMLLKGLMRSSDPF